MLDTTLPLLHSKKRTAILYFELLMSHEDLQQAGCICLVALGRRLIKLHQLGVQKHVKRAGEITKETQTPLLILMRMCTAHCALTLLLFTKCFRG